MLWKYTVALVKVVLPVRNGVSPSIGPSRELGQLVLVAPSVDGSSLAATNMQIHGCQWHPSPSRFKYLEHCLKHKWDSKERIAALVRANEANDIPYRIIIVHTEDNHDVPCAHSQDLF